MNSYTDIIAAGDKLLRTRGVTEETRQVAALVVALAHRVEKDQAAGKAPKARGTGQSSPPRRLSQR